MHSNKMAFALVLGMMMTNVWAESAPTTTSATTEEKISLFNPIAAQQSEPQTEVRVEDIECTDHRVISTYFSAVEGISNIFDLSFLK